MIEELRPHLFPQDGTTTYIVLDGASVPGLLDALDQHQPEYVCLYAGELEPDVEECAPYLVQLIRDSEFTLWILQEGWGEHWGIFAHSKAGIKAMRKHCRSLLLVKDPEGKPLYFRYYDPRVLVSFMPICTAEQRPEVFGPVVAYLCEGDRNELLAFSNGSELHTAHIPIG
jgi:hypothetical protein